MVSTLKVPVVPVVLTNPAVLRLVMLLMEGPVRAIEEAAQPLGKVLLTVSCLEPLV